MNTPLIIAFGSQVSGRSNSKSDHDFGVYSEQPITLSDRTDIVGHLAAKLKMNKDRINLVDLFDASPVLKMEVAKQGKLIDGDAFNLIRFKVRTFKEYVDTAKFRRMRAQRILCA